MLLSTAAQAPGDDRAHFSPAEQPSGLMTGPARVRRFESSRVLNSHRRSFSKGGPHARPCHAPRFGSGVPAGARAADRVDTSVPPPPTTPAPMAPTMFQAWTFRPTCVRRIELPRCRCRQRRSFPRGGSCVRLSRASGLGSGNPAAMRAADHARLPRPPSPAACGGGGKGVLGDWGRNCISSPSPPAGSTFPASWGTSHCTYNHSPGG